MKRVWTTAGVLLVLIALAACQPIASEVNEGGATDTGSTATQTAPTVLMLPDGSECSWAGEGATLAFDGKRVNYTCGGPESVLLGDPVPVDEIHWTVTKGTVAQGTNGWELTESHQVTFLLAELQLADGDSCLNAGLGATFGVNEQRVNWTCGDLADLQNVVAGPVTAVGPDAPGVFEAQKSHVVRGDDGFVADETVTVAIARIVGADAEISTMPGQDDGGLPPEPADPTAIVLPDGSECLWAGEGATLAFDGKRVNYTCGSPESVLLGDPVQESDIIWTVTHGTVTQGVNGFELSKSESITFLLDQLHLADGSTCLNAGQGATMGYEPGRVNWTCPTETEERYVVAGPLLADEADEPGTYFAMKILEGRNDSGFYAQTTFKVPVVTITGVENQGTPGEIYMREGLPYTSPAGFSITLPPSWVGMFSTQELSPEEAAEIAPTASAVSQFIYTPIDSASAATSVLTIYTFTDDAWVATSTEAEPIGEVVAQGNGVVFVAATPQSNPYPEGSEDAANFDSMIETVDEALASFVVD